MSRGFSIEKAPNAVLDYGFNWEDWLVGTDTIDTATWTVPSGITKDSSEKTTTTATVWLSGGTSGTTYAVVCQIETADGRTDERTLNVVVTGR